ncbi:MAG: branched-chain amino acid ABC transporter permease [Arenicellales bacterium]|nr:branched-chain amino acid ABC transporter permease [Arenicellales bacterium]MDP6948299.1 branched-chain amino acid ABC transporter permease [Arenicellales bacterium]
MDNLQILLDAPIFSVQLLIDGLLVGAIFALVAYGMALVWGVMNIINICQGEYVMLGGFITYLLFSWGIHPFVGIPVAFVVLYLVGWLTYRVVICRVVEQDLFISILATFGISILLQQLMNQLFTADVQTAEAGLGTAFLFNNMVTVPWVKVVGFVLALSVGVVLVLFMVRSRMGQAIRATAQNARAARIMGIDTDRVYAVTYSINAAICGAAGALVVMTWVVQAFQGLTYTVRSFMIVVVAGIGNLPGVVVAGLGLGAAESYAGFLLGAEFQTAFIFSLLVVILLWRNYRLRAQRKVLR